MMMNENMKEILEEYAKENRDMFFEKMKKESLNHQEVKLSKSRYYNLSKMNLKELSKKQLIRIIYSLQQEECFQHIIMLEKALDKACLELQCEYGQVHSDKYEWNKDQWKEWCLNDND